MPRHLALPRSEVELSAWSDSQEARVVFSRYRNLHDFFECSRKIGGRVGLSELLGTRSAQGLYGLERHTRFSRLRKHFNDKEAFL